MPTFSSFTSSSTLKEFFVSTQGALRTFSLLAPLHTTDHCSSVALLGRVTVGHDPPTGAEILSQNSACRSEIPSQNSVCTSKILQWNSASTSETFATKALRTGELTQPDDSATQGCAGGRQQIP
ncbi:uncharacterized protein LOC135114734 [Scylla paramamosain]|uniref:uncharacterized protein LOC135114734 n=1 Tax=Scylla paramamosain TaxID=85552 RepID=UPI0030828AA1